MAEILLGPAGASGMGSINALEKCKELGLKAMEIEFVYGVSMNNEEAEKIGEKAKKMGISLSVHAPYWINLNSAEKEKIKSSKKRILDSCERAHHLKAQYVIFHPAYYHKDSAEGVYEKVKEAVLDMQETIRKNKWNVILCPETTGKKSQFGTLEELIKLSKETGCGTCIDFAHLKARNKGKINLNLVCKKIKQVKHKTAHFSGIEYGEKGERRHVLTKEPEIKEIIKALVKHNISIRIINESPDPFGDSLKTKKALDKIKS